MFKHTGERWLMMIHLWGADKRSITPVDTSLDDILETTQTSLDDILETTQTSLDDIFETTQTSLDDILETTQTSLDDILETTQTSLDDILETTQTSLDDILETVRVSTFLLHGFWHSDIRKFPHWTDTSHDYQKCDWWTITAPKEFAWKCVSKVMVFDLFYMWI